MVRGPHFTYLLPPGWRVGEEGNFALVLRSPDMLAGIIVFGQSGLLFPFSPEQFAHQAMAGAMQLAPDVRFMNVRSIPAMPGYTHAAVMETSYTVYGPTGPVPIRGIVFSNVAIGWGQCNGTITLASSEISRWPSYESWLPQLAMAAQNTGPNPYGSTAMAQTMHNITQQEAAQQSAYRQWSEATWQAVVAQRNASVDRQQEGLDPMLTGRQWTSDPYGNPAQHRSITPAAVWVSRDGREVQSDDPSFDPRTPTDNDWRRIR